MTFEDSYQYFNAHISDVQELLPMIYEFAFEGGKKEGRNEIKRMLGTIE